MIYLCVFLLIKEATRLALVSGDQATYARSIRIMGDIYRKKSEINVSIVYAALCEQQQCIIHHPFTLA